MKKPFKKKFNFNKFGYHIQGTISTYRWGWKKKPKTPEAVQEKIPEVEMMSR